MAEDTEILEISASPYSLYSQRVINTLKQVFGARKLQFFTLYEYLKAYEKDPEYTAPIDLEEEFKNQRRVIFPMMVTDHAKSQFKSLTSDILLRLRKASDRTLHTTGYRELSSLYSQLVEMVAAERDVFMVGMVKDHWKFYRSSSKDEERYHKLKRDNPEDYQRVQSQKKLIKMTDDKLTAHIDRMGLVPERVKRFGKLYWGAKTDSGKIVFTINKNTGEVEGTPLELFTESMMDKTKAESKANKIFIDDVSSLRKVTDETMAEYADAPITYASITDDKVKQDGITRIFSVVEIEGRKIIATGRYKGIVLDDMINTAGRMIEGVAYNYDPKLGRPTKIVTNNPDGSINVQAEREPYVTLDQNGKLYLKIPTNRNYTMQRNTMKALAKVSPSINMESGSWSSVFIFEPKDFGAIRDALGGFGLSTAAMEKIKSYFMKLAEYDMATEGENLKNYDAQTIGGFKPDVTLLHKQKQSMAWMESRGNSGICALDTGLGKTALVIATMLKTAKDEDDTDGKFLYVSEASLKGNLPREIYKFCTDPKDLIKRIDMITYNAFTKACTDPDFGKDYLAIFFDEAHKMKNLTSGFAKAAMKMVHPHKILLTASPMSRSPQEVFILAAISNNKDLNTTEGRKELKAFVARYCETVGGRVIGVKADPTIQREFRTWVKRNLFYADKRDVEEIKLPQLTAQNETVSMDPRIERIYRETVKDFIGILRALMMKYKGRQTKGEAARADLESFRIKFAKQLKRLNDMSNMPHLFEKEFSDDEKAYGEVVNPKLNRVIEICDDVIESGGRTLFHTDSPDYGDYFAQVFSDHYPMKKVVYCQASVIEIYQNGKVVETYRSKEYTDKDGKLYQASEWKTYVLSQVVSPDTSVIGCVLTSTYAVGQNLQSFSETIMLDRDTWNAETMSQRRGRNWRQGQTVPVRETTVDVVYNTTKDGFDATLDELRQAMQVVEEDLFNDVVIEAQTEALGKEIREMDMRSSYFSGLSKKLMEMMIVPNVMSIAQTESGV